MTNNSSPGATGVLDVDAEFEAIMPEIGLEFDQRGGLTAAGAQGASRVHLLRMAAELIYDDWMVDPLFVAANLRDLADLLELKRSDTCPACAAKSVYDRSTDRYYHTDGSENRACFVKLLRGEA